MTEMRQPVRDGAILYDAGLCDHIEAEDLARIFDAEFWRRRGGLGGETAAGRESVVFVYPDTGCPGQPASQAAGQTVTPPDEPDPAPRREQPRRTQWVLRHYHRGGLARRVSTHRYLWLSETRTRAFREWRLLYWLHERGLAVPRPVAARYRRGPLSYSADLITLRIPSAVPLSRRLAAASVPLESWRDIGSALRRLHDAGVCHPDLNAHNILLDERGKAWLVDFDRGRLRRGTRWKQRGLDRLARSLRKLAAMDPGSSPAPAEWRALKEGYDRD